MKQNTRFNPTVNGSLHLGHLFTALINQGEARRSGGKFGMRFDDDQRYWRWKAGADAVGKYAAQMVEDLEYFGVDPDFVEYQSLMDPMANELLNSEFHFCPSRQAFAPNRGAAEVIGIGVPFYPLVERITAEKVIFDFMEGITWCIRGIDLLSEDCLYRYFVERFQIPQPRMTYIPRLKFEGDVVSKMEGNFKLHRYQEAQIPAADILALLAKDCLSDEEGPWLIENIKPDPELGVWAYVVH